MNILGISAYYHDAAACLVTDGMIIAAAQEERFTRIKHDANFPVHAIKYCLQESGISSAELDFIVFYDKPFPKFERIFETYLAFAPRGFRSFAKSLPVWLKDKLFQKMLIIEELEMELGKEIDWTNRLRFSEHHLSHAASAFFPSPFQDAAILTMDGVGEWATTSLAIGSGNKISIQKEILFPHSLGLLYSAFTYYTGFKVNSGEYKLMGLAPYGEPKYAQLIKDHLIHINDDGSFQLDMSYFDYCTGLTMTNSRFNNLFDGAPRVSESPLTQKEMDIAASIQIVTEEVVIKMARDIRRSSGQKNLCFAGGVALNCVANGKLLREKIFDQIWIQPAAGDAGGAIGAALAVYYLMLNKPREANLTDAMNGAYLGPAYSQSDIEIRLKQVGAIYSIVAGHELISKTAFALSEGKAVGWHQGRMEFGPRALGARSIIADPRSPYAQKQLNLKIKFRESFRPFAPSILREDLSDWFDLDVDSPYMLMVANVAQNRRLPLNPDKEELSGIFKLNIQRTEIPAVTHVDYSARIQTVHAETNPLYYALITEFKSQTGCPILVNTSFNVRGEPIVNTPEDAFRCFMGTDLDLLVIGNCILYKNLQNSTLKNNYEYRFSPD